MFRKCSLRFPGTVLHYHLLRPSGARHFPDTTRSPPAATAVATNPAPFEIPALRSPPAPRVLPATFVLLEIPQEWRE